MKLNRAIAKIESEKNRKQEIRAKQIFNRLTCHQSSVMIISDMAWKL